MTHFSGSRGLCSDIHDVTVDDDYKGSVPFPGVVSRVWKGSYCQREVSAGMFEMLFRCMLKPTLKRRFPFHSHALQIGHPLGQEKRKVSGVHFLVAEAMGGHGWRGDPSPGPGVGCPRRSWTFVRWGAILINCQGKF